MSLLHAVFRRLIKKGVVTLIEADGSRHVFGVPDPAFPDIVVRFNDRRVGFDIVRGPRLGFAEGFMDGRISFEQGDIMAFIGLIRANNPWEKGLDIERKGLQACGAALESGQFSTPIKTQRGASL